MRVVLMHNPKAGRGRSAEELTGHIRRGGHDVVAVVSSQGDLADALGGGCDVVAVAGGDGTVGKAASVVSGSAVPLAILPSGTANNMARALGLGDDLDRLVADWAQGEARGFDAADVTWRAPAAEHRARFFEAFGFGAFPRAMAEAERQEREAPAEHAEAALARDREILLASVATAPLGRYRITVDGVDRSGAYLLVELMLVPFVGPNVALAPDVDPHDGLLDVVLVRERDRDALVDQLAAHARGVPVDWSGARVRGRDVTIEVDERDEGEDAASHADGELCVDDGGAPRRGPVQVVSVADAFRMLAVPGRPARSHRPESARLGSLGGRDARDVCPRVERRERGLVSPPRADIQRLSGRNINRPVVRVLRMR